MSNNPIVVTTKPIQLSGTVKGPIVVTPQEGDSGDTTPRLGYNQPTYKVKLVANGKTFNMLLPPSIESKHPGRANPLQLPGLQIKAGVNISKLKIPGFFPIYQNLGVESLTVSMSGMFTGYDGVNNLAAANWENAVGIGQSNVEQGQDSFASASELYDFAVSNKALVQVTIYTSDGSFIPKQSTSTTFRDTSSNISFKGYIKEFEQVYIRQDRNYYMLKFEIIDFNTNKCKAVVKSDKKEIIKTETTSSNNSGPITDEDRKYRSKEQIEVAEKIKALIDKNADIKEIEKEYKNIPIGLTYQLLLYAESKNYNVDSNFKQLLKSYETTKISDIVIKTDKDLYKEKKYKETAEALCNRFKDSCVNTKKVIEASKRDIDNYVNSNNTISTTTPSVPVTPPPITPITKSTDELLELQSLLTKRGFYTGKIDGTLSGEVRNSIVRAQDYYTISPRNGAPSKQLIDELKKDTYTITEDN
jgi:hypothetical protein